VFEAGEQYVRVGIHCVLDLDDGRHGLVQVAAVELQADGAHMLRHAVQDELGRGDQSVAAFLLNAG